MAVIVVFLVLPGSVLAAEEVRHTHLSYPKGTVDLYLAGRQCAIVLDGLMDQGSAGALDAGFRQMRRQGCSQAVMVLNSAGGAPAVAYLIADFLAKQGFDTVIADGGLCYSACTYAFLGGRKRFVGDQAGFGVHQHSRDGVCALEFSDGEDRRMRTIMQRSLPPAAMQRLIALILATDCNTMNVLPRADIDAMSIANAQTQPLAESLRQAIAARDAQVLEQFRASARGPWTRSAGDRVLTVYTRKVATSQSVSHPTVWGLIEYAAEKTDAVSGVTYRSHTVLNEVDCEQKTISVIRGVFTRGAMGDGAVVWKTGRLSPVPVKPKTPAEMFYRQACSASPPA